MNISLLAPNYYITCDSHTKQPVWIGLLINKLAQPSMSPPPVSGASHASRTCNDASRQNFNQLLNTKIFLQFVSIIWLCYWVTQLNSMSTFKHKRATYVLSMSEHSSHSAGSGERRKHVMTNKHHTKFHISYIKDHVWKYKRWHPAGNSVFLIS